MVIKNKHTVFTYLTNGLLPYECYLYQTVVRSLHENCWYGLIREKQNYPLKMEKLQSNKDPVFLFIDYFLHYYGLLEEELKWMRDSYAKFTRCMEKAEGELERKEHILNFSKLLGAKGKMYEKDKKAVNDFFDYTAISQRYFYLLLNLEKAIKFVTNRLSYLYCECYQLELCSVPREPKMIRVISVLFKETLRQDILLGLLKALGQEISSIYSRKKEVFLPDEFYQNILRLAHGYRYNLWVCCEAINLLSYLNIKDYIQVCNAWFSELSQKDDSFIRHRIILSAAQHLSSYPGLYALLDKALSDQSIHVRQAVAKIIPLLSADRQFFYLETLIQREKEKNVRSTALLAIPKIKLTQLFCDKVYGFFIFSLKINDNHYFSKIVLSVIESCFQHSYSIDSSRKKLFFKYKSEIVDEIITLKNTSSSLCSRRYAAITLERLWCMEDPKRVEIKKNLTEFIETIAMGKAKKISRQLILDAGDDLAGRILALVCVDHMGLDIVSKKNSFFIRKGWLYSRKLWRFLYEFTHPRADKRQGVLHTVGRASRGNLRVPSTVMFEVSKTEVPGEPVLMEDERGWRPYLPLPDDFLRPHRGLKSAHVRFYTTEGVTEVVFPRNYFRRMLNYVIITARFPFIAGLRLWTNKKIGGSPRSYIDYFRRLKFKISFTAHQYPKQKKVDDQSVTKFFNFGGLVWPGILWRDFIDYYYSIYSNTLLELSVFLIVFLVFVLFRHSRSFKKIRKMRDSLPLSVGGWGTRGKSGVERLKAAVFHSLSFRLLSKTTGSDAAMLMSSPMSHLIEVPIYRPYDKATIWEQINILEFATQLHVDVFQWECMAIKAEYSFQLQEQWMRDDYATITNTFPDHEGQQGPTGQDVAQVISEFIPSDGVVVTSEVQLLPILQEVAKKRHASLHTVDWQFGDTMPPQLLEELPYQENVANINLVGKFSSLLGIESDVVLKAMKDYLVPDIGAFKVFPSAYVFKRMMTFINSMSANERYSTINNFHRIGYQNENIVLTPLKWTVIIVNNRHDRIPRSRVFARLLTNDIMGDQVIVMGSNTQGFIQYVKKYWNERLKNLSLWKLLSINRHDAKTIFRNFAVWLRVPITEEILIERFKAIAGELSVVINKGDDLDCVAKSLVSFLNLSDKLCDINSAKLIDQQIRSFYQYKKACEFLSDDSLPASSLQERLTQLLRAWFLGKITRISKKIFSGDDLNAILFGYCLPGLKTELIPIQNIKGPGMSLFYSWQNWYQSYEACQLLESDKSEDVTYAINTLSNITYFSLLSIDFVEKKLTEFIKSDPTLIGLQKEQLKKTLNFIAQSRRAHYVKRRSWLIDNKLTRFIVGQIENFFEPGDSIKRRKKADTIYAQLCDNRISYERAIAEITALQMRQKGGWLYDRFVRFFRK